MTQIILSPKFFPSTMVVFSVLAAIRYTAAQDWRHVIYWMASAVLISAVTY